MMDSVFGYFGRLAQGGIPKWLWFLATIGLVITLRFMIQLVGFIQFHCTTPSRPLAPYKRSGQEPTYALVTGASAGIGYGIAQALVKSGFGVILLGHLPKELSKSAANLEALGDNVHVKIIVMDARTATPEEMRTAIKTTILDDGLKVSILVNNVGSNPVAHPPFRPLKTYSTDDVDAVIDLNARFMARLTSMMLPILCKPDGSDENAKSNTPPRSLILNISSGGMIGSPWLAMYSATKAFNWALSISLSRELGDDQETRHVDSLCVVPGDVRSQGNSVWITKGSPNSDKFGSLVVEKTDMALARGWREMRPYWMHDLQYILLHHITESMRSNGVTDVLRQKRDAFNAVYKKVE